MAPVAGLEPTTIRLTVGRSTIELHRNNINLDRKCQVLSGFLRLLKSQVKEKYDIPAEVWEPMVSGSAAIASNQKYLEWLARVWKERVSTPEYIETQKREGHIWSGVLNALLSTIEEFDRVRPNLKKKDLYQYKDRQEVIDSLEQYKKEKSRNNFINRQKT